MLLSITEKCRMGCSHCMDDARTENTNFITEEVFRKALDFNFKFDQILLITGGEPTEHPKFWEFMKIASEYNLKNKIVIVTTNGMNLSDNDIPKVRALNKKCTFLWQVTSVDKYYPIKIDLSQKIFREPSFSISTSLEKLSPIGRALNHPEWEFNAIAPDCFNIRSLTRKLQNLETVIESLRVRGKVCTPQISFDGQLKLGESCLCPPICLITENEITIIYKIINFRCSKCNHLLNKLPKIYRNAIGEE